LFGNQGLGSQIGGAVGQLGRYLPFSTDPTAALYAQQLQAQQQGQFAPQGFFGNLLGQVGQPFGGAIGGLFGNQGLGSQIGGAVGHLGRYLPFTADPTAALYAQQLQWPQQLQWAQQLQSPQQLQGGQFAPQGFFGNLLGQVGQPLGGG